ncbi:hypothetical protein Lal_00038004 [Lupinus albus]|nr:hypothetical protein Lal_00038004 [Lupinus albus]
MTFQNEENEQRTIVSQTPVTQKRTSRGVTCMKKVIRARRKNEKLTVEWNVKGQTLNNKGGNTLVSYIGVLVRQNVSIKFNSWSDVRLNSMNEHVGEEHKRYILKSVGTALRKFRTDAGKCLRDADGNVNLMPPAKYENLIDEVDWTKFVTHHTQDDTFLKVSEENHKRASKSLYPYRASRMGYSGVGKKL